MPTIAELTQEQYESLPPREYAAVTRLLVAQDTGLVHPASSMNDLTPFQLSREPEYAAFWRKMVVDAVLS